MEAGGGGRGGGGGGGRRNVEKNVFVMKCNKNANIPYCGEYLSVDTGQCGVAGIAAIGKNIART